MPAMNSLVVAGVQPAARSRALAFIYSGMYAGSIVGLIVTPILISLHGWESVFYVCGVIGILWVGIFLVTTRDLATDDAYGELSEAEHFPLADTESLPEGNGDFSDVPSLKDMFSASFVWAIIIAHFCCTWGYFVLLIWLPTYLNSRFSQDVTKSSLLSAIPWMAMLIFANIGGMIADTLLKYISVTHVRKLMQTVGFLVPAFFLVLVSVSRDVVHAMSFVTLALGFASFSQSGVYANHQDVAPAFAGTLLGISNTFASVPGLVGVYVSGVVLEVTGRQWGAVFGMAIGFYVVGAMVFVGWARGERQW